MALDSDKYVLVGFHECPVKIFYFFRVLLLDIVDEEYLVYFSSGFTCTSQKSYMLMDDLLLCCIYIMNTYSAFECFRRSRGGNYVFLLL